MCWKRWQRQIINGDDVRFHYSEVYDHPRRRRRELEATGTPPDAVTCTYTVQAELADRIERDMLIPVKGRSFLCLMRDISVQDQIIFTSHSPYMLEYTENVYCITCQEGGSVIQALEKETDEETLLPVQRGKI